MRVVTGAQIERWTSLTDEDLVGRILDGQTALFEVLMRRLNERVYRTARAIVRDEAEAEDVMQQAYVNAFAHLRQFDGRAAFATWLTRITVNEAIRRVRARRLTLVPEQSEGDAVPRAAEPDPERLAYSTELRSLLERAIDDLSDGAREVFVLRQVEGLSTAETAASLGVSEDAVKTRLSRARVELRKTLEAKTGDAARASFRFERPRCDRVVARVLERIA